MTRDYNTVALSPLGERAPNSRAEAEEFCLQERYRPEFAREDEEGSWVSVGPFGFGGNAKPVGYHGPALDAPDPDFYREHERTHRPAGTGSVAWNKYHRRWVASAPRGADGRKKHLGNFATKEQAEEALAAFNNEAPATRERRPRGAGTVAFDARHDRWMAYSPGSRSARKYLGSFQTLEEAESALREWRERHAPCDSGS